MLTANYQKNAALLRQKLRLQENFDLVERTVSIGERKASFFLVDGFVKDEILEKMMEYVMALTAEDLPANMRAAEFSERYLTYVEVSLLDDETKIVTQILSGTIALIVDGLDKAFLIDARTYPARGVEEPDDDRVLRGAHDGFVETLVFNTALIRRRIRDPALTMEILQIGTTSHTDVVLCYMKGRADETRLAKLRRRLQEITVPSLTMGQESLAECLTKNRQWLNPFPKVRYTERPDAAAASVAEGKILLLTDNSPSVMLLPTGIFDFVQDSNDFYFPPLVGSYLRLVRSVLFLASLFLTPFWYLLVSHPESLPPWLSFLTIDEANGIPLLLQLFIIEIVIDGVKLASLNTPGALNNAFSVVGALLLGEFAVKAGLFVPEALLYMSFVAVASFTQPSFELGYAFKISRMLLLILIALFGLWGLVGGLIALALLLLFTRTLTGFDYCYPLIPFNARALVSLLVRLPLTTHRSQKKNKPLS